MSPLTAALAAVLLLTSARELPGRPSWWGCSAAAASGLRTPLQRGGGWEWEWRASCRVVECTCVCVGDHYLRLLLEDDPRSSRIHNPSEFFNDLYHRFLLATVPRMKSMCLQAMCVVYTRCHVEIGNFNDTEFIVTMLHRCEDRTERDRLLQFLNALLLTQRNAKLFVDAGGVRCLVDLMTLAHLHTTRATVPLQTNILEASAAQLASDEKEWYYSVVRLQLWRCHSLLWWVLCCLWIPHRVVVVDDVLLLLSVVDVLLLLFVVDVLLLLFVVDVLLFFLLLLMIVVLLFLMMRRMCYCCC